MQISSLWRVMGLDVGKGGPLGAALFVSSGGSFVGADGDRIAKLNSVAALCGGALDVALAARPCGVDQALLDGLDGFVAPTARVRPL